MLPHKGGLRVPVVFDPSTDFEDVCDGLEAVTLVPRSGSTIAITNALQRALTTAEIEASNGKYVGGDVRWHLSEAEVTTEPKLGDEIKDANSRRYTIIDKQHATLEHRWRLICRDMAVVWGLDCFITILQATYAKGAGGAMEPTWKVSQTGIRARVQPLALDVEHDHDAQHRVKRVKVYVGEDVVVNHTYRLKGPDGTLYKITGYTGAERIGDAQVINAEVTPWPLA